MEAGAKCPPSRAAWDLGRHLQACACAGEGAVGGVSSRPENVTGAVAEAEKTST